MMQGALKECLVIDLSRLLPGPYCSMVLADHGARVIAIEDRRFQAEGYAVFRSINRNKSHMTLNLKSEGGKEIFFKLAQKADVILEGFRPGVTDRLGVGYEDVRKINPKIVYCSLTGFGQTGPYRDRAGHDVNFAGYSGALSLIGEKDGPPVMPGLPLGDISGGLQAAIGILLALYEREKSGEGQYIDVSMTDSISGFMSMAFGWLQETGAPPKRGDFTFSHRYACYNLFETRDGKYLTVAPLEPRFWKLLCEYFEVPEYIPLQYDEARREEIQGFFKSAFLRKSRDEWMEIFKDRDICIGPVLDADEALMGENAKAREMLVQPEGFDAPVVGTPVKLSRTPGSPQTPPPDFGESTEAVLKELGYSDEKIAELKAEGVV